MSNSVFQNEFGINPPANESYNEVLKYKRNLETAFSDKMLEQQQDESQAKRRILEIQKRVNEDLQRVNELLKQKAQEEGADETPAWFVNWANQQDIKFDSFAANLRGEMQSMKGDMQSMKGDMQSMKGEMQSMKGEMQSMKGEMQTMKSDLQSVVITTNQIKFKTVRAENKDRRISRLPIEKAPFLNGQDPDEDLPVISDIQDIENLTREQCVRYLIGYGIAYTLNESVSLKRKLRDVLGFTLESDLRFNFHGFSN